MPLYGIEINLPFQVQDDYKLRAMVHLGTSTAYVTAPNGDQLSYDEHNLSYTERPHKQFATEDEDAAKALADTYAKSWNATVVPVEEGQEYTAEQLEPIIKKEAENAKARLRADRALGAGR
jgi:hypothetical protein